MDNSFDMYNKKLKKEKKDDDNKSTLSKFLFTILIKSLIVVLLFLSSMIFIRQNDKNKNIFNTKPKIPATVPLIIKLNQLLTGIIIFIT